MRLRLGHLILPLVAAVACDNRGNAEEDPPAASPSAAIAVATVDRGPIERALETYGTLEFASDRQRSVAVVKPGEVLGVSVIAGQTVKKGDTLLRVGPMPSGSPEVEQARIEADYGEREVARVQQLVAQKLATNQDLQRAQKEATAAQAALRALGGGGAGGAQLRAPIDGVVASVLVQRGDVVHPGTQAVVIAAGSAMIARAGFEVEDLPVLKRGLTAWLTPVYGGPGGGRTKATLSTLQRVVDPKTQLVEGVIDVDEAPDWLAAGLAVRVDVVLDARDDVVRVPRAALLEQAGATGAFVVEGGHAHWKQLEVGIDGGDRVEVKAGLAAGARVATVGRSSLTDGMAVRVSDGAPSAP